MGKLEFVSMMKCSVLRFLLALSTIYLSDVTTSLKPTGTSVNFYENYHTKDINEACHKKTCLCSMRATKTQILIPLDAISKTSRLLLAFVADELGSSFYLVAHLSRLMTKPTKWHVRPAKTGISLGICPV